MEHWPWRRLTSVAFALMVVVFGAGLPAKADTVIVEIDKAVVLRLDKDANVVYVANPAIADVLVESPRLLFILGRAPGETSLRILDSRGRDMLDTTIVVIRTGSRSVTMNRVMTDPGYDEPVVEEFTFGCDPDCVAIRTPTSAKIKAAPTDTGAPEQVESGGAGGAAEAPADAPPPGG